MIIKLEEWPLWSTAMTLLKDQFSYVVSFTISMIFNTIFCRLGASSGILLGAITLPAVMLAKMIQLTRAFSSNDIGFEGMGFLNKHWLLLPLFFSFLNLVVDTGTKPFCYYCGWMTTRTFQFLFVQRLKLGPCNSGPLQPAAWVCLCSSGMLCMSLTLFHKLVFIVFGG